MSQTSNKSGSSLLHNIYFQYFLVLISIGILYAFTCAPTVLWQDSGLFIYRIWHNDLAGNIGIALAHPLYIMIGIAAKSVPIGELAWRINMLSAIFGAIAAANLFLLMRLWLGRVFPAVIAAISLAVAWTFWQNAVWAEVYTLYAAQLFTELLVLFQYIRTKRTGYLYWLGFLNGLSIANHLWGVFPLACYGIYLIVLIYQKQIKISHLVIFIVFWVLGAAPYEYLIIKGVIETGDLAGTVRSALFGSLWQDAVLNVSVSMKIVLENIAFIILNFPTPNIILLFLGILVLWEKSPSRGFANIIFALLLLFFGFAFRYTVVDRHAFFIPFYCMAAVLIGLGADFLINKKYSKAIVFIVLIFALLPVGVYAVTPSFARKYYKSLGQRRQKPYRDDYVYWLQPWKRGYRGAERFASEVLDSVEENATIYAYTTEVHSLLYVQEVKGKRPDVKIVSDYDNSQNAPAFNKETLDELLSKSAVYITSEDRKYCPDFIVDNYSTVQKGFLCQVVEKNKG